MAVSLAVCGVIVAALTCSIGWYVIGGFCLLQAAMLVLMARRK